MSTPSQSPLYHCFYALVERTFLGTLGVYEPGVTEYLTTILADFAHVKNVYKVKNPAGRTLIEVAELLLEADREQNLAAFNREREIHKHIGDFVLFWAGIYPEALPHLQMRTRQDHLIDYVRQGKQSYAIAASLGDDHCQAPLLRKISEEFELCLYGLNLVRREMDRLPYAV